MRQCIAENSLEVEKRHQLAVEEAKQLKEELRAFKDEVRQLEEAKKAEEGRRHQQALETNERLKEELQSFKQETRQTLSQLMSLLVKLSEQSTAGEGSRE